MYWQIEEFRLAKSLTLGSVDKFDLPDTGQLGSIMLVFHADEYFSGGTGGLEGTHKWMPEEYLTKIEIITNGSHEAKSLGMKHLQVLNWLDQGIFKPDKNVSYAGGIQRAAVLIPFGRYLYDNQAGLDLGRYNTTELWITNTGTSSLYSGITVDIYLIWMRDGGAFSGFYQTEVFREWTPVAGETEYIDLPSEGVLRRFLLQGEAGINESAGQYASFSDLINTLKYTLKSGQVILYDGDVRRLGWLNLFDAKSMPIPGLSPYKAFSTDYKRGALGYVWCRPFGVKCADSTVPGTVPGELGGGDESAFAYTPTPSDWSPQLFERGMAPWSCVFMRHDYGGGVGEGLDLNANKTVQMEVVTKASVTVTNAANKLIIERFMR